MAHEQILVTRQGAIDAFCKGCVYDPISGRGTWREQVRDCAGFSCALYPYRPLPAGGEDGKQIPGTPKYVRVSASELDK